jgi:hypothetical protein
MAFVLNFSYKHPNLTTEVLKRKLSPSKSIVPSTFKKPNASMPNSVSRKIASSPVSSKGSASGNTSSPVLSQTALSTAAVNPIYDLPSTSPSALSSLSDKRSSS